jgi:hypothetical protein
MTAAARAAEGNSRLVILPEPVSAIDDPRDVRRIAHKLPEVRLPVVSGTMSDCDA